MKEKGNVHHMHIELTPEQYANAVLSEDTVILKGAFAEMGLLTKYPDGGKLTPFCYRFQEKQRYLAIFQE